jgi:CDP-glycerol glycerophosphotransferase
MTDQPMGLTTGIRSRASRLRRGVLRRARRIARAGHAFHPTVSVVVPIYNVEDYLAECLDSLRAQTFEDFEVIVVDDGSPDGSRAIAERYAGLDRRIRVIARENGGLGAARNTGLAHARGRYLTFVDSDDALPRDAVRVLVQSAESTGSDVVIGAVERFDKTRTWRSAWVDDVHLIDRPGIVVEDFLPVLRNLYTWNKLFRHEFWREQGLRFREGVAYEDQPIITQLLARARRVDVLTDVVYRYRAREDRSSISQQTASVQDLRDRVAAWKATSEALRAEVSPQIYHAWLLTLFNAHFHWYLRSPGTENDTYWSELQAAVAELAEESPRSVWDATPPDKRVLVELARQNRRADAQEFVRRESWKLSRWPAQARADGVLLEMPFLGTPDLDDELFLLRPEQLKLAHSVEKIHWVNDAGSGTCWISGWAYITKIDLAHHDSVIRVVLRNRRTGSEHVFESAGPFSPAFPRPHGDLWCDYESGTFHVEVPVAKVLAAEAPDDSCDVLLRVSTAGFTVTAPIVRLVRSGSAGATSAVFLPDGSRLTPEWRVHAPLRFVVLPTRLRACDVSLSGRTLSGTIEGSAASEVRAVLVSGGPDNHRTSVSSSGPGAKRFSITLPRASEVSDERPQRWSVKAETPNETIGLAISQESDARQELGYGTLAVQSTRQGELRVLEWTNGAVAEQLSMHPQGVLKISGSVIGSGITSLALTSRNPKSRAWGDAVQVVGGRFEAELPLEREVYRFGKTPLPTGFHDLEVVLHKDDLHTIRVPLRMSSALSSDLPVPIHARVHEGRVVRGPRGVVRVALVRPIGDAHGLYRQHLLQKGPSAPSGLRRGVLMRSYFGEHATDNGVSIQKELQRRGSDLPIYWAVKDFSVPVPEGGIPVVVNSREWYEVLSSVQYYVDNMFQPDYHSKPPGQVIVQTFHGYPFKRMGHPHWRNLQFSRARIDAYDERVRQWDYLVSPARYATKYLTRDFAYEGEVLEIGYPRNDVLLSREAGEIRAATRASLGIAEGQTAVLYAPTFRDYLAEERDQSATMTDFFDFRAATRALGHEVVILMRGHAFNARSRQRVGALKGLVDVTDYPEVSDLYLAADAAIVDYSSLRFDFGVTGKPMLFHVPDLQRYKETRGWLFDFEPSAPGPLLDTTEEVVAHLHDLEGVRERHAEQYARFHSDYLDLEDGSAARRFVDAVFVPRGDA